MRKNLHVSGLAVVYSQMLAVFHPFVYLLGALLYFYTSAAMGEKFKLTPSLAAHFVPFGTTTILLLLFVLLNPAGKQQFILRFSINRVSDMVFVDRFRLVWIFLGWGYFAFSCVLVLRLLRRHGLKVINELSFRDRVDLNWINTLTAVSLVSALSGLLGYAVHFFSDLPLFNGVTRLAELTLVLLLYLVGYMGFYNLRFSIRVSLPLGITEDLNRLLVLKLTPMKMRPAYLMYHARLR